MPRENRLHLAVRGSRLGEHPRSDEVINNPNGSLAKLHDKALRSWENKLRKSYIEAARMATEDIDAISRVVEVPKEVLEVYYEFFFDIADWDRLDKIEHIEDRGHKHKTESLLKLWTMTQGLEFLAWRLGKKVSISPVEGLIDLFSTCMFRSKEAMFNGAGTEAGEQSIKWTKQSTDIARLLKMWVTDSSQAKKELEIAIKEVVPEFGSLDDLLRADQEVLQEEKKTTPPEVMQEVAQAVTKEFEGISELEDDEPKDQE